MKKKEPCYKKSVCAYVHKVAAGETLYKIARHYGVDYGRLMALNGITNPYNLRIGTEICIPPSVSTGIGGNCAGYYTIREGDTLYSIARNFALDLEDLMAANSDVDPYNMHVGMKICIPPRNPVNRPMPRTSASDQTAAGAANTASAAETERMAAKRNTTQNAGASGSADTASEANTTRSADSSGSADTANEANITRRADSSGSTDTASEANITRNSGSSGSANTASEANIMRRAVSSGSADTASEANIMRRAGSFDSADTASEANITRRAGSSGPTDTASEANITRNSGSSGSSGSSGTSNTTQRTRSSDSANTAGTGNTTRNTAFPDSANAARTADAAGKTTTDSFHSNTRGDSDSPAAIPNVSGTNTSCDYATAPVFSSLDIQKIRSNIAGPSETTNLDSIMTAADIRSSGAPISSGAADRSQNAQTAGTAQNNTTASGPSDDMIYTVLEAETVTGSSSPSEASSRLSAPGSFTSLPYVSDTMPDGIIYNVEQGETLTDILRKFGICFSALDYNNSSIDLNSDLSGVTLNIPYGDKICIAPNNQPYIIRRNDTLDNLSVRFDISTDELLRLNPTKRPDDFSSIGSRINISGDL